MLVDAPTPRVDVGQLIPVNAMGEAVPVAFCASLMELAKFVAVAAPSLRTLKLQLSKPPRSIVGEAGGTKQTTPSTVRSARLPWGAVTVDTALDFQLLALLDSTTTFSESAKAW